MKVQIEMSINDYYHDAGKKNEFLQDMAYLGLLNDVNDAVELLLPANTVVYSIDKLLEEMEQSILLAIQPRLKRISVMSEFIDKRIVANRYLLMLQGG
jgi:hypothetical protein